MAIGTLRYAITNFITKDTPLTSSSEDSPLYVLKNLFNVRPSKPFRFDGIGVAVNVPEWVCVDLTTPRTPTLCALFNHNLVLSDGGDQLDLTAYDDACGGTVKHTIDMIPRRLADFENIYQRFSWGAHQYFMIEAIDKNCAETYIEFGEWFLGEWQVFTNARLQPGRADGPVFFEGTQTTYYGQIWSNYYAEAEGFTIEIKSINDPAQVDELRLFLSNVKQAGGKFVFIPDDNFKFCYYVHMTNMANFGRQLAKGATCEHYVWTIELRTLVKGVELLG